MNEMILAVWKQFKQLYFLARKKYSRLQGGWTHDLRDTGALLHQLSY